MNGLSTLFSKMPQPDSAAMAQAQQHIAGLALISSGLLQAGRCPAIPPRARKPYGLFLPPLVASTQVLRIHT
jgi:hypothetical protein